MRILPLPIVAAAMLLTGCGQNSNSNPPAATNNLTTNDAKLGNDYLSTLTKADKSMTKTIDTTSLNNTIDQFQVAEGRYPKDLNELVQKKYLGEIPTPPYGYKLNYDSANGTVTVVPQ
jgi:uncharacterized lipoprotein YajG